jgi:hypothetical protein
MSRLMDEQQCAISVSYTSILYTTILNVFTLAVEHCILVETYTHALYPEPFPH